MSYHDPYRPSSARGEGASAPKAEVYKEPDPETTVPDGTTKEVLAWVGNDADKAKLALDKEESHDEPRKGLVKELNSIIDDDEDE